ncbi:MAG: hypothetical protein CMM70_03665 [Rhodospirillaceae bacterium]|nr:hypothetical protein [Rhodospirillaceae bacterium]
MQERKGVAGYRVAGSPAQTLPLSASGEGKPSPGAKSAPPPAIKAAAFTEAFHHPSVATDPKRAYGSFRFVAFTQSDDSEINIIGTEDLDLVMLIAELLDRDRSLGGGVLDDERLCVLFREPMGKRQGRLLVADRRAAEGLIRHEFGERLTGREVRLILQSLAGQSLQLSAVRDRVSIETKKSQSKSMLSKLGFPDLGHLRAVLLAQIAALASATP